jgi:hypothetical protein
MNHGGHIAQVYSTGLEYAFCTLDYKQHLPWVYCKDFLHDAVYSFLHGTNLSIYGYQYDPKSQPAPNLKRMRLLVANKSDNDFGSKIENVVDFVNQVEKDLKIPSFTRAFKCVDPPEVYKTCGVYMFSGSHHWLLSPPMISLFTLSVRAGFVHTKGNPYKQTIDSIIAGQIPSYQTADVLQLKTAKVGLERLVRDGYQTVFGNDMKANYPPGIAIGTMHNNFGIVSFSKELTKTHVPAWHAVSSAEPVQA